MRNRSASLETVGSEDLADKMPKLSSLLVESTEAGQFALGANQQVTAIAKLSAALAKVQLDAQEAKTKAEHNTNDIAMGLKLIQEVKLEADNNSQAIAVEKSQIQELTPAPPTLGNAGFEDGSITGSYEYASVPEWTKTGGTVFIKSGCRPWGGTQAEEGSYFLGLQRLGASITQSVANHGPGKTYQLNFSSAKRSGYDDPTLKLYIDVQLYTETFPQTLSTSFSWFSVMYTATSSNVEFKFENSSPSGDRTLFLDGLSISEVR